MHGPKDFLKEVPTRMNLRLSPSKEHSQETESSCETFSIRCLFSPFNFYKEMNHDYAYFHEQKRHQPFE